MSTDDREFITRERCDAMMPAGERVHTFVRGGSVILGCDVDRSKILAAADEGLVDSPAGQAVAENLSARLEAFAAYVEKVAATL